MEKKVFYQIQCEEQNVMASQGITLLESLNKAKIVISQSCGGHGTCGTCLVHIVGEVKHLPSRDQFELEMAQERGFKDHERLACQLIVDQNLKIRVP
jgi:ferredoxin, 2Fe-2S